MRKFRSFRGIDYLRALSMVCEIGDVKKFPTALAFMSYRGLVPSEHSSGKNQRTGRDNENWEQSSKKL
jgi:transposase